MQFGWICLALCELAYDGDGVAGLTCRNSLIVFLATVLFSGTRKQASHS
jgi:hypothetical protein